MCGIYAVFGSFDESECIACADRIRHRGPDKTVVKSMKRGLVVFHRLSIMDPTEAGDQPFVGDKWTLVCNGEIYNAPELKSKYNLTTKSHSDCEVIWKLLEDDHMTFVDMVKSLYGVYAIVAIRTYKDGSCDIHMARDRVGVRPLYWCITNDNRTLAIASEPQSLNTFGQLVKPFSPDTVGFVRMDAQGMITPVLNRLKLPALCVEPPMITITTRDEAVKYVRTVIENVVKIRMMSDRPIACMLSGGVDSSTIAALVAKFSDHPIHTFSIGLEGSTDLKHARIMANHIKSIHHEVVLTEKDFLDAVPDVIRAIQSYDVTTVRASTPMFLLSKYISQNTEFKVIFSGEGPDEVCGSYMYFHASPSVKDSATECIRLVQDMHYFDVLRADRSTAAWGLELRVPFLGVDFIQTYWSIDPELRVPYQGVEKWILRKAAEDLLPAEICWRPKEAFSDGVSSQKRSWFKILQERIESEISDDMLQNAQQSITHHTPKTKEALWMRQLYEKFYPNMSHLIPYQWLPRWVGNVSDPSARVLSVYKN
jgi:asparagine synthase (glutamine-hydrolysing)